MCSGGGRLLGEPSGLGHKWSPYALAPTSRASRSPGDGRAGPVPLCRGLCAYSRARRARMMLPMAVTARRWSFSAQVTATALATWRAIWALRSGDGADGEGGKGKWQRPSARRTSSCCSAMHTLQDGSLIGPLLLTWYYESMNQRVGWLAWWARPRVCCAKLIQLVQLGCDGCPFAGCPFAGWKEPRWPLRCKFALGAMRGLHGPMRVVQEGAKVEGQRRVWHSAQPPSCSQPAIHSWPTAQHL